MNEEISDLAFDGTSVAENAPAGTVVGTASATDPDSGETFTYELTGDADGRFEIDPETGVVTVADGAVLDFEQAESHTITVKVTDSAGHEREITVVVELTDQADSEELVGKEPTAADSGVEASELGTTVYEETDAPGASDHGLEPAGVTPVAADFLAGASFVPVDEVPGDPIEEPIDWGGTDFGEIVPLSESGASAGDTELSELGDIEWAGPTEAAAGEDANSAVDAVHQSGLFAKLWGLVRAYGGTSSTATSTSVRDQDKK